MPDNEAGKPLTDIPGKIRGFLEKVDPAPKQSTAYPASMKRVKAANEEVRARAVRDLGGPRTPPYQGGKK